jgi:hypothetical protein
MHGSRLLRVAAPAALLLLAAGCGSKASSAGPLTTAPSGTTVAGATQSTVAGDGQGGPGGGGGNRARLANLTPAEQAGLKIYAQCLVDQGISSPILTRIAAGQFGGRPTTTTVAGQAPASTVAGGDQGGGGFGGGQGGGGQGGGGFGGPPVSIDATKLKAATDACATKAVAGIDITTFLQGRGGGGGGQFGQAIQAYLSCLKDHGYVPATTTTAPGATTTTVAGQPPRANRGGFGAIDQNDPAYKAADATCHALLPANFGQGGPGGANASTTTTVA